MSSPEAAGTVPAKDDTSALSALRDRPGWLLAAADPGAIASALRRRVPELSSGVLSIRNCRVKRVRMKSDSHTTLYRLTLAGADAGQEQVLDLRGEILAPGSAEPAAGVNGTALGTPGWRCYVPELRCELRLEPPEPALPSLPALTDPERARALLEDAIRRCSPAHAELRIESCTPRVMRAKGSRCTVLYELEFPPGRHEQGPTPVVAKTYRGDKGENAYAGMRELWSSKLGASPVVRIAEPLAFVPELKLLVQGPVPEEQTLKQAIRSAFEAGASGAVAELAPYVEKAGAGLAELHTSGVVYGDLVTWEDKLADVREVLGWLAALKPEVVPAAKPLLARLEARAAARRPTEPVPSHGSFRPNQVLVHRGGVGFIDFDRFGRAEAARDLASFRTALKDAALGAAPPDSNAAADASRTRRLAVVDELAEAFLAAYAATATVDRDRVDLWEALDIFTTVLHCWTKMESGLDDRLALLDHHLRTSTLASA